MPRLLTIAILGLLCASCTSSLPEEGVEAPRRDESSTGVLNADTSANEGTPTTIDSLEPIITREPLTYTELTGSVLIGNADAPRLTIVTDYGCEYCREFSMNHLSLLEETFIRDGRLAVRLLFAPRREDGVLAAQAALCAQQQDQFATTHLYLSTELLTSEKDVPKLAKKANLDGKKLTQCLGDSSVEHDINLAREEAKLIGASRVPYFILGDTSWIGLKHGDVLVNDIEKFLQD